jgi:hypothetical protein
MPKKIYEGKCKAKNLYLEENVIALLENYKRENESVSAVANRLIKDGFMSNQKKDDKNDYSKLRKIIKEEIKRTISEQVRRQEKQMKQILESLATTIYLQRFLIMHLEKQDLESANKLFENLRNNSINWTLKGMRGEEKLIEEKIEKTMVFKKKKKYGGLL